MTPRIEIALVLRIVKTQQLCLPLGLFLIELSVQIHTHGYGLRVSYQKGDYGVTGPRGNAFEKSIHRPVSAVRVVPVGQKNNIRSP